jgi:DnaK suppressor protein
MTKNNTTNKLGKEDLEEIKGVLLVEKNKLESALEDIAKKNPKNNLDYVAEFHDVGDDETDNVSEVEQYSIDLSLEQTLEKSLRDVQSALDRLAAGKYGLCKYCQQPIDVKRLKARPTSTSCVACKTRLKSL